MKAVVRYECPVCHRSYDTPEQAESCYKSPRGRFHSGDVVWAGQLGSVYQIDYVDPVGYPAVDGASCHLIQSLRKAACMVKQSDEQVYLVGPFWCKAELFPVSEAQDLVRELAGRLNQAERFLSEVEKCHRQVATQPAQEVR